MKFDFHKEAFFDNHTHLLLMDKTNVSVRDFIGNYYHGGDARMEAAYEHLPYQGVILSLVNSMAEYLGCEADLETVVKVRNTHTDNADALRQYIKDMYADENIVGTTLDCELPMGHPDTLCFPCDTRRLFQYEKPLFRLLKSEPDYDSFLAAFLDTVRKAKAEGFAGLKSHIAERYSLKVYEVPAEDARKCYKRAQEGDKQAEKDIYFAAFSELLLLAGELKLPLHFHTGSSGFGKFKEVYPMDPLLMVDFLSNRKYADTTIVFLHGSYPFVRHSAMMCFNFPNVYMDFSQTLPWEGMGLVSMLEDALSLAPHDKIMLGSGQHFYSETAWLAARTAKAALAKALEDITDQKLLNEQQALRSARMILSENAIRIMGRS